MATFGHGHEHELDFHKQTGPGHPEGKKEGHIGNHARCGNRRSGTRSCGIECLRDNKNTTAFEQNNKDFQVDVAYLKNPRGERIGHIEVVQNITEKSKETEYRKKEIQRIGDNLRKLSLGDFDFEVKVTESNEYTKGLYETYNVINEHLLKARGSIQALVNDADMLFRSAIAGRLDVRADLSSHQGEFKKVVAGVNSTLDAVVGPINEAMRIADSYANGDLTARVEIETKGDFTEFASSLDKIGENLTDLIVQVNRSVDTVSATSQDLASSAEEMNASTEQVSATIQTISRGAQSQATQVDETAKIMADMSTSVTTVVERSRSALDAARKSAQSADVGKIAVDNTVKKMQEISKVVSESAVVIGNLGKRSEEMERSSV